MKIEVVGFDMDQTLYPKSPEIDEAIQKYLYQAIAEHHNYTLVDAEKLFKELYKNGEGLSGSQTLRELQIPRASELVQEALEDADITDFLQPDDETIAFLEKCSRVYPIDLITGSNRSNTLRKMSAMAIDLSIFNHVITADDASKSHGDAYELWMSYYSEFQSYQFLYVGDRPKTDHIVPASLGIQTALVNIANHDDRYDCLQLPTLIDLESELF